jgi:hypothetical protein
MIKLQLLFATVFVTLFQQVLFPVDEYGKYTFHEVVEIPGMSQDDLFKNGESFLKKVKVLNSKKKYLTVNQENYALSNKGSFYVYQYGSVNKAIAGAVEYDILLEVKDGRYRYTITNFIFNEFQRNRYGKYEPMNGKNTPLETEVSNLNKKGWEKHRQVVYDKTQELIQNLQSNMIYTEESKKYKKIKKDENW